MQIGLQIGLLENLCPFVALQDAFDIPATLVDYRVSPITSGADAMAEVAVIIQVGADTYSGRGVSTDVVEGSARAFVAALNRALVASTSRAFAADDPSPAPDG